MPRRSGGATTTTTTTQHFVPPPPVQFPAPPPPANHHHLEQEQQSSLHHQQLNNNTSLLFARASQVLNTLAERQFEASIARAENALRENDARQAALAYAAALQNERALLEQIDAALEEEASLTFDRPLRIDDDIAAKVASHELWILCTVVGFEKGDVVRVLDADDEHRVHFVKQSDTLFLPREPRELETARREFQPPRAVFAMYPETTAFYKAQVVSPCGPDDTLLVRFANDENDLGLIPDRPVPVRFVTRLPSTMAVNQSWNHKSLLSSVG